MKELFYPSTYHAMKAGPCRVGVCKHKGECGKCKEYGALRRYAARDTDRIHELRTLVKEMEDEKRISDAVIQSMRDKKLKMAGEIAAKDAEISSLRLKREKEISDAFFCGYDPEEALVAQCSTCRFFRKKHSHCTLNDSLTNAKYKCSKWEFKTNKECADEYKKSINNEVAELREENAHLRAALKPVLECKVMSAMTAEIAPGRSKYCATIIEEAQHIYNEGETK